MTIYTMFKSNQATLINIADSEQKLTNTPGRGHQRYSVPILQTKIVNVS